MNPLMMIYGLQYAITGPITTQLWVDRTCLVNLKINESICRNLINFEEFEDIVQKQATQYIVIGSYIRNILSIIIVMYLGPLTDYGRKPLMYFVFLGHAISGLFVILFVYHDTWPAQFLWISNIFMLFGGYLVLQTAMYGYVSDTSKKE